MFAKYLRREELLFKHALGMRDVVGQEFHPFHEIFFLIGKEARFASENFVGRIGAHTLVIIPKERFHQFDPVGEERDYHRYVLQFDTGGELSELISDVMSSLRVIREPRRSTVLILERMAVLADADMKNEHKELLLKALFCEFLMELKYSEGESVAEGERIDVTVESILSYVDSHYLENITVESIARALNFSVSHISHVFKNVMHISLYSYVLKRKLIHARHLILGGARAAEAATLCGFGSYSGFYKVYLKYFGVSPSDSHSAGIAELV